MVNILIFTELKKNNIKHIIKLCQKIQVSSLEFNKIIKKHCKIIKILLNNNVMFVFWKFYGQKIQTSSLNRLNDIFLVNDIFLIFPSSLICWLTYVYCYF